MDHMHQRYLCKLANAYIFLELYNRDFLKSKSFVLAEDSITLTNKLMHIVKTSVTHAIDTEGLSEHFGHVSFSRNRLSVQFNMVESHARGLLLTGMSQDIIQNARVGLGDVMNMALSGYQLVYQFDSIGSRLGLGHYGNNQLTIDIKAELDAIVNTVMYVPTSLSMLGVVSRYITGKNMVNDLTMLDVYYIIKNIQISRGWRTTGDGDHFDRLKRALFAIVGTEGGIDMLARCPIQETDVLRTALPAISQWHMAPALIAQFLNELLQLGRREGVNIAN